MGVAERLRQIRGDKTLEQFAQELGTRNQNVHNYEKGRKPSFEFLLLLQKKGYNIEWVMTGEGPIQKPERRSYPQDGKQPGIPLLSRVPAGRPAAWYTSEHISAVAHLEDYLRQGELDFALHVEGDSMYPYLFDGDLVVVSPTTRYAEGDVIVARCEADEVTVKRYRTGRGVIRLIPENPRYETLEVRKDQIEILGKVTVAIREVRQNHRGGYDAELVAMLRDPGIADLAGMIAELPDEFREAVRLAIKKVPPSKEKGKDLALWAQRVFRRAGDEADKLFDG